MSSREKHEREEKEKRRARHAEDIPEGMEVADQAEGKRGREHALKVGHTLGQAEGEREAVEEDLRRKEKERGES